MKKINPRNKKLILIFLLDLMMAAFSLPLSLFLRLGADFSLYPSITQFLFMISSFSLICFFVFKYNKLHTGIWRYTSFSDLLNIIKSVSVSSLIFVIVLFLYNRMEGMPRATIIINWFVLCFLLGLPRLIFRALKEGSFKLKMNKSDNQIPVLLIGVSEGTQRFIRTCNSDLTSNYKILGIISEKDGKIGGSLLGIDILGGIEDIKDIISNFNKFNSPIQKLIVTGDTLTSRQIKDLIDISGDINLPLARLVKGDVLKSGLDEQIDIKPIALEDLLRRPQRSLDKNSMGELIFGQKVLITGAGGSIGSELCRQIASFNPSELFLIENSEFALYKIDLELGNKYPSLKKVPIICDVRNKPRISYFFNTLKPDLVFHAAALKHVPMTEKNVIEGLLTNVIGTKNVADCAKENFCKGFVMISTDKAVNPANVMGASKRLAESYCQAMDLSKVDTKYMIVKFGNVLGSTGSVIPLFEKQLKEGGPLTVTHPEVTRYFMTIKEAVELVLQASASGIKDENLRGKIFVLEMGSPIKIAEIARQVIKLAGLTPDKDIKIEYTGLREGEKLYEELFHEKEQLIPSKMEGIMYASPRACDLKSLTKSILELKEICEQNDKIKARTKLHQLVPEFIEC